MMTIDAATAMTGKELMRKSVLSFVYVILLYSSRSRYRLVVENIAPGTNWQVRYPFVSLSIPKFPPSFLSLSF